MKGFLRQHQSNRWSHDGWAVKVRDARRPLEWTVSTTREEAREFKRDLSASFGMLAGRSLDVVKVKISVEEITP